MTSGVELDNNPRGVYAGVEESERASETCQNRTTNGSQSSQATHAINIACPSGAHFVTLALKS